MLLIDFHYNDVHFELQRFFKNEMLLKEEFPGEYSKLVILATYNYKDKRTQIWKQVCCRKTHIFWVFVLLKNNYGKFDYSSKLVFFGIRKEKEVCYSVLTLMREKNLSSEEDSIINL